MNSEFHQSYRATEYSNNTKWYLKFPSVYQKLAGQIQLKNTELRINIIVNFVPKKNCINRYLVSGEAFSNNLVKISRSVKGELFVNDVKNRTVVAINVKTSDFLAQWDLQTNLTLLKSDSNYDEWIAHGTIKSDIISEDKIAFFIGFLKTEPAGEECKFSGKVNLHNANLVWNLKGSVNSPQSKQATIPRGAFSNMSIQNVVFKKSNFFNDFDKDVFEGELVKRRFSAKKFKNNFTNMTIIYINKLLANFKITEIQTKKIYF